MIGTTSVIYLFVVLCCLFSCTLAFFGQSIMKSKPPPPTPPPAPSPSPAEPPMPPQGPILERGIIDYKGNTLLEKSPDDPRYVITFVFFPSSLVSSSLTHFLPSFFLSASIRRFSLIIDFSINQLFLIQLFK